MPAGDERLAIARSARTKISLKGKPGLEASHVFGKNVATLTREKLAIEPQKKLEAVGRMDDLPEFPERAAAARGAFAGSKMGAAAAHGASAEA